MILNDGICLDQNTGWFLGMKTPMLYEVAMEDFEINPICMLPSKNGISERLSQKIIHKNGKLYILPDRSRTLYILNLDNRDIEEIDIPEIYKRPCMLNGWFDKSILYCYMHLDNCVASIDLESRKFLGTEKIFGNRKMGAFESINVNGVCYFVSKDDYRICKYNLNEKKKEYFELDEKVKGFNTIVYEPTNKMIYVTGFTDNIYVWSAENNEIINIIQLSDGYEYTNKEGFRFYSSHICGDKIAFLSSNFNENYDSQVVFLQKGESDGINGVIQLNGTKGHNQNIIEGTYDGKLIFFDVNNNELNWINLESHQTEIIEPKIMKIRNKHKINGGLVLKEDEFTSLKWFVEGLTV